MWCAFILVNFPQPYYGRGEIDESRKGNIQGYFENDRTP